MIAEYFPKIYNPKYWVLCTYITQGCLLAKSRKFAKKSKVRNVLGYPWDPWYFYNTFWADLDAFG